MWQLKNQEKKKNKSRNQKINLLEEKENRMTQVEKGII